MRWLASLLFVGLCLLPGAAETDTPNPDLVIEIEGAKPSKGQVMISVFDDPSTYMKRPIIELTQAVDVSGAAQVLVTDLAPGSYAVAVVYDRDSDGELDTGLFGIPTEKVGFSNNAKGRMGPAPWEKARFEHSADSNSISITLGHARRD